MNDKEQCAMCLGYFDVEDTEQPILCKGCLDKAAGYDIASHDRKFLMGTMRQALAHLEAAESDVDKSCAVALVTGMLHAAVNYVRPEAKENCEAEHEQAIQTSLS